MLSLNLGGVSECYWCTVAGYMWWIKNTLVRQNVFITLWVPGKRDIKIRCSGSLITIPPARHNHRTRSKRGACIVCEASKLNYLKLILSCHYLFFSWFEIPVVYITVIFFFNLMKMDIYGCAMCYETISDFKTGMCTSFPRG